MGDTRKLAAILVADVVGYSRLAGADEERLLARLRTLRSDLIDPTIAVHKGRVVKRTGDGAIVEFRSAVDAVRFAVEVQDAMVERNAGVSEDRRIVFRIGIHIGDVVEEEDGDLMGDGVNIAARLQSIAQPGAICLSEDAYRQVKQRLDLKVNDLGPMQLKNIAEPIRVYLLEVAERTRAKLSSSQALSVPPRLSIVVLPFLNIGGDPEQDYFVDGVTESLTTDLSRIRGMFVIARNTAFTFKGKPIDVKQIGGQLNVRYVLEGSVQRGGSRMRVNVQLIDAESGDHLWAERFEKPIADLFEMQDEVVARLASSLNAEIVKAEARRAERAPNPDAMDCYFRGRAWHNKGLALQHLDEALRFYERALALDPENVDALAGTAWVEVMKVGTYLYTGDRATHLARALAAGTKAVSLAPEHAYAQHGLASAEIYNRQAARGIARCERVLELDRNIAWAHTQLGIGKIFVGLSEETEAHFREALRLSPKDVYAYLWLAVVGHSKVHIRRYEEAIEWITKSISAGGTYPLRHFYLAIALANLDRMKEAHAEVQVGLSIDPNFTISRFRAGANSDHPTYLAQREHMYEGMRKARVPEG
jgi:TolB-like protein